MDTILTPEIADRLAKNNFFQIYGKTRKDMHTDGALFSIDELASTMGVVHSASITQHLFKELYPWAEDANHDIHFDERVADMITAWKKEFRNTDLAYGKFEITFETYVKHIKIDETKEEDNVETVCFPLGRPRTKRVSIFVACIPGDFNEPTLIFGLLRSKFDSRKNVEA